ncbi:hypothetical protein FDP41_001161 [Naegleria fowleri]|uniref:very-long-chain (3R)-3-hydroxyacyl-CoA dehydratase n=1 Tax=Naegleria fowleri TaxID=5763 RepID=A0A6A5C291_NAEFO|nr:uncharacterized protein FDP41_001161 [Naegleria fowleri]KAF0980008.1 hypothetical protein FDP41_001161 [Naegleria fowleri]CAG4717636.1 unnamed protein product [Naegleria fowleri]
MSSSSSSATTTPRKGPGPIGKAYLFLYNAVLCGGWGYILYLTAMHHVEGKKNVDLYPKIEKPLQLFQTLAVLEIVHSMLGLVSSPIFTTLMQVFSRLFVVWFSLNLEHRVKYTETEAMFITSLLVAWCVTEVIRYSFYALKLYDICPYIIVWLRYTTFIVLYPLGVSSELALTYFRLKYVRENRPYSLEMPNPYNMSFDSYIFVWIVMLSYLPGFPQLYLYMFTQRKKVLAPPKEKSQ